MQVTHLIMTNAKSAAETAQATPDFLELHASHLSKAQRIRHAQKRVNEIRASLEDMELALLTMCGIDTDDLDLLPMEARRVLAAARAFANDKANEVAHRALQ